MTVQSFDALGRDVAAAAASTFGPVVGAHVRAIWAQEGLDQGENPNHLWTVSYESDENGFRLSASLKDANVFVQPGEPDVPATPDEIARSQALAESAGADSAPVDEGSA